MSRHQPKHSPDGKIEFCPECGSLLAARKEPDVPWIYSTVAREPCDARFRRNIAFRAAVDRSDLVRLPPPR